MNFFRDHPDNHTEVEFRFLMRRSRIFIVSATCLQRQPLFLIEGHDDNQLMDQSKSHAFQNAAGLCINTNLHNEQRSARLYQRASYSNVIVSMMVPPMPLLQSLKVETIEKKFLTARTLGRYALRTGFSQALASGYVMQLL